MKTPAASLVGAIAMIGLMLAACAPGGDGNTSIIQELPNTAKPDRAGMIIELTDDAPRTMYFQCDSAEGCDIEFRASLRAPGYCELFDDKGCGSGTPEELHKSIASLRLETPAGDVHETDIAIRSADGYDFSTEIEKGEFLGKEAGVYFVDITRAPDTSADIVADRGI